MYLSFSLKPNPNQKTLLNNATIKYDNVKFFISFSFKPLIIVGKGLICKKMQKYFLIYLKFLLKKFPFFNNIIQILIFL